MNRQQHYSNSIKKQAARLGFLDCGIAKAEFLEAEAPRLEQWLQNDYHGKMQYMENHFDKRLDPRLLVEGAKSVISLSYNYFPSEVQQEGTYKISKYAYGQDYHHVIKDKLRELLQFINDEIGEVSGRCFVDSAPVLERAWAEKSGLGWNGKHSLLIQKQQGSFFFLAELVIDLELAYDEPFKTNHCGSCTRCIDACPTQAILPNNTVDGSKCISYLTIELKDAIPTTFKEKMEDWMFGCDVCQDVCPWNRFSKPHNEPLFAPQQELLEMTKHDWQELTQETFSRVFKKSAVKRTKFSGLVRNINFIKS
ncbi:tRNA epoxyqueuosine(34) reductase QueG [Tenacibaculum tangerinum]|uniref:Epoxyqueuosine reductase n=1 Tax=Tenacibaculum tangerinum TaxID=3038772 RepID=A0ABY8L355_9FLAO|nr:tRNA epoxyqueuosine(34) reductase QueG [Tenacibaculum tangerinum]WGH74429.1 tRNA epoxyqueuosine(34) reductase QueG [Tenacibaculum tangerinum]